MTGFTGSHTIATSTMVITAPISPHRIPSRMKGQRMNESDQQKGEFVLIVAGADPDEGRSFGDARALAEALLEYLTPSQAARVAAKLHGVPRRELYQALDSDRSG